MLSTSDVAQIRARQRSHWNAVAPGWAAWLAWTERNFAPLTAWLAGSAGWRPGARVLDVACGPGYPAFAAAAHVLPGGTVVAIDSSSEMIAEAARQSHARGFGHVDLHVMDAEALELDDVSFDAVSNAYGLMFCPEPGRALAEAYRVLRAGGRLAVVTWAEPSASPFFEVLTSVAAGYLSLQPPPADAPGPFRFASPDELIPMVTSSGFHDVRVSRLSMTFDCGTVEDYCQLFSDVAWKSRMAALSDSSRARLHADVARAVEPHVVDGRIRLATTSLCTTAMRT